MNDCLIRGELITDEVVEKFINVSRQPLDIRPTMELDDYLQLSVSINDEIRRFGARWLNHYEFMSCNEIVGMMESEIDNYPTIKSHDCIQRYKRMALGLTGVPEYADKSLLWNQKVELIWSAMLPSRWKLHKKEN